MNPKNILSLIIIAVLLAAVIIYRDQTLEQPLTPVEQKTIESQPLPTLQETVIPSAGVTLPVVWGKLGPDLVASGVIDIDKFTNLYAQKGENVETIAKLIETETNERIKITPDNAGQWLNLFWALGLANQNPILETGEMADPRYGGAGKFASTGGWTLAQGEPMDHYSRHRLLNLTPAQQALVEKISKGIYRPCCGNSTHFPDCNHGLAMLGLLELMAAQNVSEPVMWQTALTVNAYWFPDTYLTIATYLQTKGLDWSEVDPQEILGAEYSSAQGFAKIAAQVSDPQRGAGSCGV